MEIVAHNHEVLSPFTFHSKNKEVKIMIKVKLCIICSDKGLLGRNWWVSEKNPCKHCGNTRNYIPEEE